MTWFGRNEKKKNQTNLAIWPYKGPLRPDIHFYPLLIPNRTPLKSTEELSSIDEPVYVLNCVLKFNHVTYLNCRSNGNDIK